jgi:cation diffusion facilitator family transporter
MLMKILTNFNRAIARIFIEDFDDTTNRVVRAKYGLVAGWLSIVAMLVLFVVKMALGIMSGSVSVIANAFHLLSHLANSIILVLTYWIAARPATASTPFGHGRMEHVGPLIMSIFLFVSGIQIAEHSVHQTFHPAPVKYWPALPWILFATILVKQWLGQFVQFMGTRVDSHAILASAEHHRIEAVITLTVIGGLVAGHHYGHPEIDGYIGILASLWIIYLGFNHGRHAIVPILGKAPSREMLRNIRDTAKKVDGIEDIHEIIVHDYGSMYILTLHVEIPESMGPAKLHELTERCEARLRKIYGGEVVCHTDPLMEHTPETQAIEHEFKGIIDAMPPVVAYHDFRVVADSPERVIIVADIDVTEETPESQYDSIASTIQARVKERIPKVSYCSFYITPKFAY